jgi:DNA-binding NtrC family response regulator
MDLQMPEINGLDAINAIRGEVPDAKIIVLTTYKGDVQIRRALKAGAQGYLLENTLHKRTGSGSPSRSCRKKGTLFRSLPRNTPSMRRMTL